MTSSPATPADSTARELFDNLPHGVVVHQLGRILYVNPAMVKLLGHARAEDLIGSLALELMHPDDRAAVIARVQAAMREGQVAVPRQERFLRRDGSWFLAEVTAMPMVFEGEQVIFAIVRDVSERLELQRRIMLADRMASLGTLAAGVAHEINTPLSYILHNLRFVRGRLEAEGGQSREEFLGALRDAEEGGERVRQIVRALTVFSREEGETRRSVDMARAVRSAIQMVRGEVRSRARLVEELAQVAPVLGDELRISQVVVNLLKNAAQAITGGAPEANEIAVRLGPSRDARVEIAVSDTGVGIPPEVRGRLFEPFFTTKPVGEGTGLGLSICHGIVTGFGGELLVESEPGKGSTFRVLLPAAAPEQRREDERTRGLVPVRRGRILIVDDEPRFGLSLARLLEPEHEVAVLTSAREAAKRISGGERFDLVLCDLMMPDMTGADFYAEVKRTAPEQANWIVYLTGGAYTQQARTFLATVRNRQLEKPIDMNALSWLLLESLGPAESRRS